MWKLHQILLRHAVVWESSILQCPNCTPEMRTRHRVVSEVPFPSLWNDDTRAGRLAKLSILPERAHEILNSSVLQLKNWGLGYSGNFLEAAQSSGLRGWIVSPKIPTLKSHPPGAPDVNTIGDKVFKGVIKLKRDHQGVP